MIEIDQVRHFIYCHVYVYIGNSITCYAMPPCVATRNRQKNPILAFKIIEFDANQEPVYDFLLVINSNLGPILHRY